MTLLVTETYLRDRRTVVSGPLAALASGLRTELAPLIERPIEVPREKALLSRRGGRCEVDGALLTFDPFDPHHLCPQCGREYEGELHDRFRLYWYQLWLAERAVHAALLSATTDDASSRMLAVQLLDQWADQYLRYPNADNVLGPSRPFFSTYLESIWLLQLAIALSLLEAASPSIRTSALGGKVRERLILPSATLIASYDEGMSNRQVWNNAAMMAAGRLLDDRAMFERAIHGQSGLHAHLGTALLKDGSWYEGENYHLFAHRGLWYGERLAHAGGHALPPRLAARYREAFVAPFRTVLPDLTYPSRRDSQYAVSIRQPRFAEACELGLAYADDERLVGMLARLYDPSVPRGESGRRASSADVERNLPGTGLQRADLSWRTLLCARAHLPPLVALPLESDLLPSQGIGVIRRDEGQVYVSLDYGHPGGGHGHPDRLNLTLMDGTRRWFDDPGTGSYVDPTLHWYRSTLAHNAPLVDRASQARVHGELTAFADDAEAGWMSARAALAPGLVVSRTVVVLRDYLIDVLEWESDTTYEIALPIHGVTLQGERVVTAESLDGGDGLEDGFNHIKDVARVEQKRLSAGDPRRVSFRALATDGRALDGWTFISPATTLWIGTAPAPPNATGRRPLAVLTLARPRGRFLSVWSWAGAVLSATTEGDVVVVDRNDGSTHRHRPGQFSWTVDGMRPTPVVLRREAKRRNQLQLEHDASSEHEGEPEPQLHDCADDLSHQDRHSQPKPARTLPARFLLGEESYRRSEQSWYEAGAPGASLVISHPNPRSLLIEIDVLHSDRRFISTESENALDNEPSSINGDSVQLYAVTSVGRAGLLLVPEGVGVGARPIDGWSNELGTTAEWHLTPTGYRMDVLVDISERETELQLDVIINETAPGRARRRGQLVLSGADGEFVYLRGDRHEPSRLLRFLLQQ